MTKTTSALVLKPLHHQGRSYVRGDRVEVSPTKALSLRRKGFVTLTKGARVEPPAAPPPSPAPDPETPPTPDPPTEPTRRRRRSAAEPTEQATATGGRQTYRTRDMVAEDPTPQDPIE